MLLQVPLTRKIILNNLRVAKFDVFTAVKFYIEVLWVVRLSSIAPAFHRNLLSPCPQKRRFPTATLRGFTAHKTSSLTCLLFPGWYQSVKSSHGSYRCFSTLVWTSDNLHRARSGNRDWHTARNSATFYFR
jgi:hypothetical protein